MDQNWFEYVKSCYDLVIEGEGETALVLPHEVEAYVVHLMAKNINRVNIGDNPVAIQLLTAINTGRRDDLLFVADECLLIHSFPLKQRRWPTEKYFQEMGTTAYGLAGHIMEKNFENSGKILSAIFNKKFNEYNKIN